MSTTKRRVERRVPAQILKSVVLSLIETTNFPVIQGPAGDIKAFFIVPKTEHGSIEKVECLSKASLDTSADAAHTPANSRLAKVSSRITKTFLKLSGQMVNRYGSDRRPHVMVYCPPCLHMIESTFDLHTHLDTAGYQVTIRVDFRLPISCCPPNKLSEKLSLFHDSVYHYRNLGDKPYSSCFRDVDTAWIRQQILELHDGWNEDTFLESRLVAENDDERCAAIIVLSEPSLFTALAGKFERMGKPWQEDEVYWLVDRVVQDKSQCVTRREMGYFSRI
jgi:hypothetical protein